MDNKSCIFISLKYTLIALLLVDLINSLIAGTAVIAEIDSPKAVSTVSPDQQELTTMTTLPNQLNSSIAPAPIPLNHTDDTPIPTKTLVTYVVYYVSIIFFTIMGLIGVAGENFYLSILTACVMVTEGAIAFFITLRSKPNILTIVFNLIIAILAVFYAMMIKFSKDSLLINRIEPITSTRERASPPIMITHLNGSIG